jgi:hypothetical protein
MWLVTRVFRGVKELVKVFFTQAFNRGALSFPHRILNSIFIDTTHKKIKKN